MPIKSLVRRLSSVPSMFHNDVSEEVSADDFYSRVQVHGLEDIGKARRRAGRLFWAVVTVLMIVFLVANVVIAVGEFFDNPLYTATTVTNVQSFPLPRVTVCPYNFFKYDSFVADYPKDWHSRLETVTHVVAGSNVLDALEADQEWGIPGGEKAVDKGNYTIREFTHLMNKYSYSINDTLQRCMYQGRPLDCFKYARKRIADGGKLCFELEGLPPQKPRREPLLMFLKVINTSDSNFHSLPLTGVTVLFNFHRPTIPSNKVYVRSGERCKMTIEVSGLNLINKKDEPCLPPATAHRYPFKIMAASTYDEVRCSRECFQNISYESCGCLQMNDVDEVKPKFRNTTTCTVDIVNQCVPENERERFMRKLTKCKVDCKRPCYRRQMQIRQDAISFAKAGNQKYELKSKYIELKSNDIDATNAQHFIVLEINYKNLVITNLTQRYTLTFNMFISNVGGLMGLWIGASILSIFQLVIFGSKIICHRIRYRRGQALVLPDGSKNQGARNGERATQYV